MLRDEYADRLLDEYETDGYVYPAYEDYCFSSVPGTLDATLGAQVPDDRQLPTEVFDGVDADVDNVVCVLLDGYGFDQWTRDYEDVPLLSRLSECGTVTPLTAIYPSETAAAILTFHSGQYPVEHGQIGWNVYYEELGGIVQPLPFTTPDGDPADEVYPEATREMLNDATSCYDRLLEAGVDVTLSQPRKNVVDPETDEDEPDLKPYGNVAEMAVSLRQTLEAHQGDGRDYCYGYVPEVDSAAHLAGTESEEYRAQLAMTTECVRRELIDRLDPGVAENTLLVLTADHGHVDTVREENVDLREGFSFLWDSLATNDAGDPIPPAGSGRNVHLFLQDGTVEPVREELDSRIDCVTFTREEALDRDLFGPAEPGPNFRRRCGDLIVVHRNRGVSHEPRVLEHVGMHGGLTREEMLIPFAAAKIRDLQ